MKTVITTVGLSLLKDIDRRGLESKDIKEWDHYNFEIDQVKKEALQRILKEGNEVSAELKSISKIISTLHPQERIDIRFISSYTILSALASEVLKDYINEKFPKNIEAYFNRGKDAIYGLQVRDADLFMNEGMPNLLARLSEILEEIGMTDSCGEPKVLFNMTGGFKATIPYLTFFAQLHDIPTYYIFERSDQLIEIPYFPLEFDFGIVEDNWHAFRLFPQHNSDKRNWFKSKSIDLSTFKELCGSEDSFQELLNKKIIAKKGDKVIPTLTGMMIYKRYSEIDQQRYSLYGRYIELKMYKYWQEAKKVLDGEAKFNEYTNKIRRATNDLGITKIFDVEHSKLVGTSSSHWEVDIFLRCKKDRKEKYVSIEIKPIRQLDEITRKYSFFKKHIEQAYPNSEFWMCLYTSKLFTQDRKKILEYKSRYKNVKFICVVTGTQHKGSIYSQNKGGFDWNILKNPPIEIK